MENFHFLLVSAGNIKEVVCVKIGAIVIRFFLLSLL